MTRFDVVFLSLLVSLGTLSATGIVAAHNHAYKLRNAIEHEQKRTKALEDEWRNLQIEQSTQAAHRRVEQLAVGKLGMRAPDPARIVILDIRP
jgi:cell division protein FtsL